MARREVSVTHPDRAYFPSGFTKLDMIRYYGRVAPAMLPHLRDRAVTLIRFPEGVRGERFYEKNAPGHAPAWIKTAQVPRRHHQGFINYLLVNNVETLAWCANLGAIEFHPFLHRATPLQRPTQVAFDLDPGEGADLLRCIEVAGILRGLFEGLGLHSFPKVTGSKGLQLYIPLNTAAAYETTGPFAKAVAELLARRFPKLVVSEMPKTLRRDRVMIDWSQNSEAKTTVCVYSLRGKHDQPFVSAPVTWDELERAAEQKDPARLFFGPEDVLARIAKQGDLFAPVLRLKQRLPAAAAPLPSARRGTSLRRYAEKRDFSKTAEPAPAPPERSRQGSRRRFVIQKHAASHLHYDFRLEMGGTLKSWAVPKGLPYETGVRRAAFQVEDHPIDYLSFEGTIPKGQYGGGTVMVWDIGTYDVIDGSYGSGDLKLWLEGRKLKGEWHIFRIESREAKPVWLIVKGGKPMKPLSPKKEDSSAITGRSMTKIASDHDAEWQGGRVSRRPAPAAPAPSPAPRGKPPRFIRPMVPRLVDGLPQGEAWSYEIKWDGYRALIAKHGTSIQLWSRNENSLAARFPMVVEAGRTLHAETCLVDGEIVAVDAHGVPSFQALQNSDSAGHSIVFYAFDLLSLEGEDLRSRRLSERRGKLQEILRRSEIRLSTLLRGSAKEVVEAVRKFGLEGVVAKKEDSPYRSGDRSLDWRKMRLQRGQEFVIGGFRPGMQPFESILVGYYEGRRLMFAGKVRPGFTPGTRAEIWRLIKDEQISKCPFANLPDAVKKGRWGEGITAAEMTTLRWVRPRHVVEIEFVEWTSGGHLRHAAYRGLRPDKPAKRVVRETPGRPQA